MNMPEKAEFLKPDPANLTPATQADTDFVTVLTVAGRGNKLVTRDRNGDLVKDPGPPISEATAQTFRVEGCDDMAVLQKEIGRTPDRVLILGYVPGTEPASSARVGEAFTIVSQKIMGKALGVDPDTPEGLDAVLGWHAINGNRCTCRLKANMAPSSWCLFDIDAVRGMPDHLANMSSDDRRDALAEIIPGFAEAGVVIVPSTTGRVLVDGQPMDASGEHFYVQLQDASDLERFGAVLLQRSMISDFGFMRPKFSRQEPDKIIAYVPWGIADPTTFSHERLVYDGAPTTKGKGLEVGEATVEVLEGGRLDTSLLEDLSDDEAAAYADKTGQRVRKERRTESVLGPNGLIEARQIYRFSAVDNRQLKMDTVIDTKGGSMTLEEYWRSDKGKLRCQTPFRDSTSENGILNRHRDGTPFVYDNGTRTRYRLSAELITRHRADIYLARLCRLEPDDIKDTWTDGLRRMEPLEREKIRQRVHSLTKVNLKELSAELKSAQSRWKAEDIENANAALKAEIKDSGKVVVSLNSIDVGDITRQTEEILFADENGTPVLSHGSRLVTVRMAKPTTVREVIRERDAEADEVPLAMMVDPYQFYGLMERITECVSFIKTVGGELIEMPPPGAVVRAMLEKSHKRAPALVGIIEHPVMGQTGELLVADGLSADGLYFQISKDLVPALAQTITVEMAQESLGWIEDVVLADFPFATDVDLAGAVSALLTAIQRRMFDSNEGCPGFLTTAPVQSSGKTAFFQLLFELVWGRTAAATNWSSSDEELGKHILAILLEGHGGVLFDNLEEGGRVESNALAKVMTSPKFKGRILGENREATVPTNCLWCFTGNNISASGDFNTRILAIKIDPGMENPDQRTFSRPDLAEWCEEHRAEFFKHALTIMVGYRRHLLAGEDTCDAKPTRYSKWDAQVRHAMLWAGSDDPALLFEQNKAEDPKQEGRRNLLASWSSVYGDEPQYLRDVIDDTAHAVGRTVTRKDENLHTMGEAIGDLLPNGKVTSRHLSTVVRKFAGQWIDGYRISAERTGPKSHKSKRWYVECQG